jgi:hypothetical protein
MKTLKLIQFLICSIGFGLAISACAGSSGSTTTTSAVGSCSVGYVYSSTYGCLTQSTCPTGYGLYNNQCVVATSTATSSISSACGVGYVYSTRYGQCFQQAGCPTGYGNYGGYCYAL